MRELEKKEKEKIKYVWPGIGLHLYAMIFLVTYLISVSFAMTINKIQGHSLSKLGLYLTWQLYVALSHVKNKKSLKVIVSDADDNLSKTTINVVSKEVVQGLWSNGQSVSYYMFCGIFLTYTYYKSQTYFTYIFYTY